jgi:hypothetical protein
MKKLWVCFLFAFSNPVSAGEYRVGDVFYCESEAGGFLSTLTNWQHKHWKPFKFKYQIKSDETIQFGTDPYFENAVYNIGMMIGEALIATSTYAKFDIALGRFVFTSNNGLSGGVMTGTCDKF